MTAFTESAEAGIERDIVPIDKITEDVHLRFPMLRADLHPGNDFNAQGLGRSDRVRDSGLLYSANFSLGVNLYFRMIARAAELMRNAAEYDPYVHEK